MKSFGLLTLCASLMASGSLSAQDASTRVATHYPEHSVRMVVGFTAGGPTDVIARIIAERLSTSTGQQFYVDNRPGAGGNIASAEVAKAAPDGYTIIVVSTGFMVNMSLYAHVPYDAIKDFAPITMVAYSPNVVLVNPSVPANNVRELISLIKANPNKYSFAGPGIGSTPHLSGELFKQKFGLDMVHVPFPGAARRSPLPLLGIRRSLLQPCRRRWRISRRENCERLLYWRSSEAWKSRTYRPCKKPAILIRKRIL